MKLSDRIRPGVECAPWVYEEVCCLEAERDRLRAECNSVAAEYRDAHADRVRLRSALAACKNALASCIEALTWEAGGEPLPDMSIRARSIAINALREGGSDGNAI